MISAGSGFILKHPVDRNDHLTSAEIDFIAYIVLPSDSHRSNHTGPLCPCPRSKFGCSCLLPHLWSSGSGHCWGTSWDTMGMRSHQTLQSDQHHTLKNSKVSLVIHSS